jgi:hypothetical protein
MDFLAGALFLEAVGPEDFLAAFLGTLFFEADFFADFFWGALLDALFFDGTLPPSLRASERPMAMACLRLVTFLPLLPLFNEPSLFSCIALSTLSPAFFEYFAIKIEFIGLENIKHWNSCVIGSAWNL